MEFIRVDPPGCDLAVVRRPPASAPGAGALVFLHGLGDSASSFAAAFEAEPLAPFEILLADLLGHGASDKPAGFDYRPASHAAVLFQALRSAALPGPLHLVGYSLGGAVAVELARFPLAGLASLVLIEPALDPLHGGFAERVGALPEGEFRARYAEFLEPYASPQASDADRRWAESAAFASSTAIYRSAKGLLEAARRAEILAHLRESSLPRSLVLSHRTYGDWPLARELVAEGAALYLVDAPSRMPQYESPTALFEAVRKAAGAAGGLTRRS